MIQRVVLLLEGEPGFKYGYWDEVAPALTAAGVDFAVGSVFSTPLLKERMHSLAVPYFDLGCSSVKSYPLAAARLARRLRKDRVEIAQGTGPIAGFVAGLAARMSSHTLGVYHRQHLNFEGKRRMALMSWAASRTTSYTLACSRASAGTATSIDMVPPTRVEVAFNAATRMREVGAAEIAACRDRLGLSEDAHIAVAVARLRPEKGLDVFIRASDLLNKAGLRSHAVIVGSGEDEERLMSLSRSLHLEQVVHFVGHQDDVSLWYHLAEVAVMPSFREGLPVAAAEAMLCGRPLIVSAVGGLPEMIEDGSTGLLVKPRDPQELADALARVFRDRDWASMLGASARDRALRDFTNQAMVRQWMSAWDVFKGARDSERSPSLATKEDLQG